MNNNLKATAMDSVVELNPKVKKSRSTFNLGIKDYTSFNVGDLVPIGGFTEVLPGDTFSIDLSMLVRLTSTTKRPPMDNLHMDVYAFFVPNRFVDKGWEETQGASASAWTQPSTTCSMLRLPSATSIAAGSLLNHLGVPIFTTDSGVNTDINIYPVYAYMKIVNDWFRDENLQSDITWVNANGTYALTSVPKINNKYVNEKGSLFTVAKFHDLYTSCLPSPQKGPQVSIPLGTYADVKITGLDSGFAAGSNFTPENQSAITGTAGNYTVSNFRLDNQGDYAKLVTDLSTASAASINSLRIAFQTQKAYELDARGGSARYCEQLENRFGVKNPDLRLGRSELLGHYRFDLGMSEVATTSGIDGSSATAANLKGAAAYLQGAGAGSSKTGNRQHICVKSFTEHGIVLILACVRPDLTYQQGLDKFWMKKSRFDFYEPIFAHVGEMPVYKKQLFASGQVNTDNVFGYQEAWYEYRYKSNNVSGILASDANEGFDIFHYAQDFASAPSLGSTFIQQAKDSVDRTLAVTSSLCDQFILNAQGVIKATRVMPLFSVPGLIDHF